LLKKAEHQATPKKREEGGKRIGVCGSRRIKEKTFNICLGNLSALLLNADEKKRGKKKENGFWPRSDEQAKFA